MLNSISRLCGGDYLSWRGTSSPRTRCPGGQLVLGPRVRGGHLVRGDSWSFDTGILLPNNYYIGAIMQCLFNNPKMTVFDQLTVGHPSHCDIACCMSGKLNNWAVLYAALVMLSHTDRSNMQPCNLSAAVVPSEWYSAPIHPILKPNTPDPRNYRRIALQSVVLQVLCKVLNARLSKTNYILSDEQNCFRLDLTIPVWTIFAIGSVIGARK